MLNHAVWVNSFDEELDELSLPMQSSNLCCIRYSDAFSELEVHFVNGARYTYFDVPKWVVRKLLLTRSAGHFFVRQIRNRFVYSEGGLDERR